jgi:Delta24(24(1))-sterol reductase
LNEHHCYSKFSVKQVIFSKGTELSVSKKNFNLSNDWLRELFEFTRPIGIFSVKFPTSKNMKETKEEYEFGGPVGALMIIIFSHCIPYYLWYCTELNNGSLAIPTFTMIKEISEYIKPTTVSLSFYFGFLFFEAFLAYVIPGFIVEGLPLKHEGNKKLQYNCNAFQAWWITLFTVGILYYTNIFKISILVNHLPSLILISSLFADFLALYLYLHSLLSKTQIRMSGNVLYDFFMGASLNPRLGALDLKMFAEGKLYQSIYHFYS